MMLRNPGPPLGLALLFLGACQSPPPAAARLAPGDAGLTPDAALNEAPLVAELEPNDVPERAQPLAAPARPGLPRHR